MKKIVLTLITSILFSGSAFACYEGNNYGCPGGPLRSLIYRGGFYIKGTGIAAVPSETGLGTFTDTWMYATPDGGTLGLSKPSKLKYRAAWAVKVGYDIPCTPNNIEVEYTRLHNRKHNVNTTADHPVAFGSTFFNITIPITPGEVLVSDSHLKYTLNQVDVNAGHCFVDSSCHLLFRPLVGVRFASLKHDLPFVGGDVRSRFRGAGPMIGADCQYEFCGGFGLVGHFDTAVLMGNVESKSFLNFGSPIRFKSPKTDRVVTSISGKLGLAYNFCICRSSLLFEVGYQANVYIAPFDIITAWLPTSLGGLGQRISQLDTTNFAFTGPYVSLTWHV